MNDELAEYNEWIDDNEDYIMDNYIDSLIDFPESIYEGFLDDDYEDAENNYLEGLTISDVPDSYIQKLYEKLMEDKNEL